MWCSKETYITEVRPIGEHDWRVRDELKPVPEFTWQQRLIHGLEDCLESAAKSLLTTTKRTCKAAAETAKSTARKAAQATKKAARDWWRNHSPALGLKVGAIGLAALIIVTNVSEKLGG